MKFLVVLSIVVMSQLACVQKKDAVQSQPAAVVEQSTLPQTSVETGTENVHVECDANGICVQVQEDAPLSK